MVGGVGFADDRTGRPFRIERRLRIERKGVRGNGGGRLHGEMRSGMDGNGGKAR